MFKKMATTALALACLACVSTVNADEPASSGISQSSLAAMGLSGLQTSDDSARAVRGQGFVTFGSSTAFSFALPTNRRTLFQFTNTIPTGELSLGNDNFSFHGSIATSQKVRVDFARPPITFGPRVYSGGFALAY
jgi:hypothetical protein